MANQQKVLLTILVAAIASLSAVPSFANAAPSVIGSFAEQVAINKTRFTLMFDIPIEDLTREDFRASAGCTIAYVEAQDATAQVDLLDCPSGLVELTLLANSVGSSSRGPVENHVVSIEIDALAPTATFSEIQILGAGPFTYATNLRLSEPVDFDISRLQFSADAACTNTATAFDNGWRLLAVCDFATMSWSLPPNSLQDAAGNRGPASSVQVSLSHLRPTPPPPAALEPAPSPAPVVNPEPAPAVQTPLPEPPAATPDLTETSSPTVSESVVPASTESEQVEWDTELVLVTTTPPPAIEPIASSSTGKSLLSALQQESEPAVMEAIKPAEVSESTLAIAQVSGDAMKLEDPKRGQWILLVGLGSLALLVTGLIRRFSGR
jgi:hypothetical protein